MSADGAITIVWGDGEHKFRLGIGQLRELQDKINAPRAAIGAKLVGPMTLYRSIADRDAWPDEVMEVMRLGLIGGGMEPVMASVLVKRYINPPERPVVESMVAAQLVLMAALVGVPGDEVGKKQETEKTETESQTTDLSSPNSTAQVRPSASPRKKSTNVASGSLRHASTVTTRLTQ